MQSTGNVGGPTIVMLLMDSFETLRKPSISHRCFDSENATFGHSHKGNYVHFPFLGGTFFLQLGNAKNITFSAKNRNEGESRAAGAL